MYFSSVLSRFVLLSFLFTVLVPSTYAVDLRTDEDGDGLSQFEELLAGTDPLNPDTDGDGMQDGREVLPPPTDPLNPDTDGDGLWDSERVLFGTSPLKTDTDGNGVSDADEDPDADGLMNITEQYLGTNGMSSDTDGNGIMDGDEDPDSDGLVNLSEVLWGTDPFNWDTDGDGFSDGEEVGLGMNPTDIDSDDDGLLDAEESAFGTDPALSDTDGNGIMDGDEDPDSDGLVNLSEVLWGTDPFNADTDGDGFSDGDEVLSLGSDPTVFEMADLAVSSIELSDSGAGFEFTLTNEGNRSVTETEGTVVVSVDGTVLYEYVWSALPNLAFLLDGASTLFGPYDLEVGTHNVSVCVDTTDLVTEISEVNNCFVIDIVVLEAEEPVVVEPEEPVVEDVLLPDFTILGIFLWDRDEGEVVWYAENNGTDPIFGETPIDTTDPSRYVYFYTVANGGLGDAGLEDGTVEGYNTVYALPYGDLDYTVELANDDWRGYVSEEFVALVEELGFGATGLLEFLLAEESANVPTFDFFEDSYGASFYQSLEFCIDATDLISEVDDEKNCFTVDNVFFDLSADADGDLLSNADEVALGTEALDADTDDDGLDDATEVNGVTDPFNADSDADSLLDGEEVSLGTDPNDTDSDDDGLLDAEEGTLGTDPLSTDTDLDGVSDADEDSDADGLSDLTEQSLGTDPLDSDTDDDSTLDGAEVTVGSDPLVFDAVDLTVGSITIDGSEDFHFDVRNLASVALLSGSDPSFSITKDGVAFSSGVVSSFDPEFLSANGNSHVVLTDLILTSGTYVVCVDPEGVVTELSELNNCSTLVYADPSEAVSTVVDTTTTVAAGSGGGGGGLVIQPTNTNVTLASGDGDVTLADDGSCEAQAPFVDIVDGDDMYEYVYDLWCREVVEGRDSTHFAPYEYITRAEFLKVALLSFGHSVDGTGMEEFSDVRSEDWFYVYVVDAVDMGAIEGYADGTFMPNAYINRAEALTILMRIAGVDTSNVAGSSTFTDVVSTDWFASVVILAAMDGVVEGYPDNTFKPGNYITRAEASAMAVRSNDAY